MAIFDDPRRSRDRPVLSTPIQSVGFSLSQIGLESARQFGRVVGTLGLEPRHFAVLYAVGANDGFSQQAVGDSLSIPASTMVSIIDYLESAGLVERRLEPHDRRMRTLHLTTAGHERLRETLRVAHEQEARLCAGFTDRERGDLLSLLGRVAKNLGIVPTALPDHGSGERLNH